MASQIDGLLEFMLSFAPNISDLNFSVGRAPLVEVNSQLVEVPIKGLTRLSPYQTEQIALHLMHNDKLLIRKLLKQGSCDLSYSITGKTRFRVNIFSQRGTYSIVLRVIPNGVPTVEEMGLPYRPETPPALSRCGAGNGILASQWLFDLSNYCAIYA